MIFDICDRFGVLPHEASQMTLREMNNLLTYLPYKEVEENAEKMALAGAKKSDVDRYRNSQLLKLEAKDDPEFDQYVAKETEKIGRHQ